METGEEASTLTLERKQTQDGLGVSFVDTDERRDERETWGRSVGGTSTFPLVRALEINSGYPLEHPL